MVLLLVFCGNERSCVEVVMVMAMKEPEQKVVENHDATTYFAKSLTLRERKMWY